MIETNPQYIDFINFDVVIIGAGPAGIVLALELEKKGVNIALIEAGGAEWSEKSQEYYKGEIYGEFPRDLHISRLRMFGGTTGHWGGTSRPLDYYDFFNWPIKKLDIDKYLKDTLDILEIKNSFREKPVSAELKLIEFQVSKVRFADKYFNRIKNSKYIRLFLNSPVLEIEGNNGTTTNILCYFNNLRKIKISGKFFVIATGGIENSRLLLLANLKNKNLFKQGMPIGNYWYEHPFSELGRAVLNNKKTKELLKNELNYSVGMFNSGNNSISYGFAPTKQLIDREKILNSCCWLVLTEHSFDSKWKDIVNDLACIAPNLSNKFLNYFKKNIFCGAYVYSSWEQDPQFENKIILSDQKKDSFNLPVAKIIYKKSELVRKTAKTCIEEIGKYLLKNNLGRIAGNSFLFNENEKYLSDAGWHHMGGTIMGNNPIKSVVDKNLQLHGSNNMFVLGSSVFPTGGHANPTITIIQLSLRLSDYINKILV